jgi:hypothetical protein
LKTVAQPVHKKQNGLADVSSQSQYRSKNPMLKSKNTFLALMIGLFLYASPLSLAQQKRPALPGKAPAPAQVAEPVLTFDSLLADDNYRVYSEVRNVGSLVRSHGFDDLLDPLIKSTAPPKQFSTVLKWIKAHADPLAGSRLCIASWPSKKTLPPFLLAIEFASADEAKKFEAELRGFLPKLDPKPAPSPSPRSDPATPAAPPTATEKPDTFAQLQIKQTGALILISDKPLSLRDLKPRGSRLLAENPNFAMARSRFASESVFLYVDFKAIEKDEREQRQKWEKDEKLREERAATNPTPEPSPDPAMGEEITSLPEDEFPTEPGNPTLRARAEDIQPSSPRDSERAAAAEAFNQALFPLSMALFGGRTKYPEAIGAALAFEGDSYIVRALVVNSPENRSLPLPFMPQLASGPELTPSSPNVLPGDVDLFAALSLDYSQVYEGMIKTFAEQPWLSVATPLAVKRPSSPFAGFEERAGIKVKEELIPLLGNEIAFVLPKASTSTTNQPTPPDNEDRRSVHLPELMPVIAISLRDREAVKRLIPKMLESMGLKGASSLAHTEKRNDTEIVSYANMFSYAFIGDFLIFAPDVALTRRAVDSYLNGETLSSNSRFRNATRWQSRQVQGQVYLGSDIVEHYVFLEKDKAPNASLHPGQPIDPLTYALSNEGLGPLHEVHIPRNLLMMVVAGISSQANESPIFTNESIAKNVLRTVATAQARFRQGNGRYGSLDELIAAEVLTKDLLEKYGYKIELTVLSNKFEATATPNEYGKTGRRSFYIDESGLLRGGDHAGGAATLSDKPVNE